MNISKYTWSTRRFWKHWLRSDFLGWYYNFRYGFEMGLDGTMIPHTGKGKYVSVFTKGKVIQIKHESGYNDLEGVEIRIIPYKDNHGVMVEKWKNGKMYGRNLLDINQLTKDIIFASNVEQLTGIKYENKNSN